MKEGTEKQLGNLNYKKLLRKAGVLRTLKDVNPLLGEVTKNFLVPILRACVIVATQGKKVTLDQSSLDIACRILGINLTVGVSQTSKNTPSLATGASYPRRPAASQGDGEAKKKRKFKQGTVSAREVSFQQKHDNLVFRKLAFAKYCKTIVQDPELMAIHCKEINLSSIRSAKALFPQLQVLCERYLLSVASSAWKLVEASKKKTLEQSHIKSVLQITATTGAFAGVH